MCADFRALPPEDRFDLVVAAEVAYDPPTFGDLASVIARHLAPDGTALVADGYRTDTRPLYGALQCGGVSPSTALDLRVPEAGHTIPLRITALRHLSSR